MAKNIVFCADGTWNSPHADENGDQSPDPTNVYKLFLALAGTLSPDSLPLADEQEKELREANVPVQVAKYLHGVGNSRNPIVKLLGGTFGAGVISRVVRGYTFISRNYAPGDHIYIAGFSRGAYTARALAGLIASQGLLAKPLTADKTDAYRRGAEVWYRYRQATLKRKFSLAHLLEIAADLPAFLSQDQLTSGDLVPVDRIACVAVWDTVGAMGLPEHTADGERIDAFQFADLQLSTKVRHGLHAVSVDEQRMDFTPCLWDAAGHVTQVLFPGAHADVGGGYPSNSGESGLSDCALQWMLQQLAGQGVRFGANAAPAPDTAGTAHAPWLHAPWNLPGIPLGTRIFRKDLLWHVSVAERMAAGMVVPEPGLAACAYRPRNLP